MAEYIVSARKYRPMRFNEMVGQEQVATTLKNAIRTGQLAHSFLFCGPRGVGKTTAARILAKTINCENITADYEACGKCSSCVSFQQNASFNIHELDAASNNSVEDIRGLVDQVRFPPQSGKYKIYIIDEVHMLSQAAFNAFLKTLEEPPSYCKFILATTEKQKILPTILSRCQIFDFKRISIETIVKHLKHICEVEKIDAEDDALHIVAQKADGGMRDALSIFDRLSSYSSGKLTYASVLENLNVLDYDYFFKATDALLTENLIRVLQLLDEILKKGFEGDDFVLGLCEHMRNLLFCKDAQTLALMEVSENLRQKYGVQSTLASPDFLVNCLQLGNQCDVHYRASKNKRLTVELALIKMCYVNAVVGAGEVKKKVSKDTAEQNKTSSDEVSAIPDAIKKLSPDQPVSNIQPAVAPSKETASPKQPALNKQALNLSKSKKVLTADLLNSDQNVELESLMAEEAVEQYKGEIIVINAENILKLWEEYATGLSDEKKGFKALFKSFQPVLDMAAMNRITLKVSSDIQRSRFAEAKQSIETFFSQRTGVAVEMEISKDQEASTEMKPYTPKEKIDRLMQKNPAIRKMQQTLGLELDYD